MAGGIGLWGSIKVKTDPVDAPVCHTCSSFVEENLHLTMGGWWYWGGGDAFLEGGVGLLSLCSQVLLLSPRCPFPCQHQHTSHEVLPKTVRFGGYSPPLVWEEKLRARGLWIMSCISDAQCFRAFGHQLAVVVQPWHCSNLALVTCKRLLVCAPGGWAGVPPAVRWGTGGGGGRKINMWGRYLFSASHLLLFMWPVCVPSCDLPPPHFSPSFWRL